MRCLPLEKVYSCTLNSSISKGSKSDNQQSQECQKLDDEPGYKKDKTAYGKGKADKAQTDEIKQNNCPIVFSGLPIRPTGGDGENFVVHMIQFIG